MDPSFANSTNTHSRTTHIRNSDSQNKTSKNKHKISRMVKRKQGPTDDNGSASKRAKSNVGVERRVTRGMTTEASRKAVLDTSELLENILLHLPGRDTVRARRVNHQFQDAINSSLSIQQNLFLRPRPAQPPLLCRVVGYGPDTRFANLTNNVPAEDVHAGFPLIRHVVQPNTALFDSPIGSTTGNPEPLDFKARWTTLTSCDHLVLKSDLLKRISPSVDEEWTRMLVSDPPIKEASVQFWIGIGKDVEVRGKSSQIRIVEGVTLGELIQAAFETVTKTTGRDGRIDVVDFTKNFDAGLQRPDLANLSLPDVLARLQEEHRIEAKWSRLEVIMPGVITASDAELATLK